MSSKHQSHHWVTAYTATYIVVGMVRTIMVRSGLEDTKIAKSSVASTAYIYIYIYADAKPISCVID